MNSEIVSVAVSSRKIVLVVAMLSITLFAGCRSMRPRDGRPGVDQTQIRQPQPPQFQPAQRDALLANSQSAAAGRAEAAAAENALANPNGLDPVLSGPSVLPTDFFPDGSSALFFPGATAGAGSVPNGLGLVDPLGAGSVQSVVPGAVPGLGVNGLGVDGLVPGGVAPGQVRCRSGNCGSPRGGAVVIPGTHSRSGIIR